MSYGLIAVIIFGITQVVALLYLRHEFLQQLRRSLALETLFQKWNADQSGDISQRLDQILEMLRTNRL
jgi:hypothetical protein